MRLVVRSHGPLSFLMNNIAKYKSSGFTLIELMIVVAIIAIIAAISLPSLLRSRMTANEANAIGGLRTISSAEIQFRAAMQGPLVNGVAPFGELSDLGTAVPPYLDSVLGQNGAEKSGYLFNVGVVTPSAGTPPSFSATAIRLGARTGNRAFFVDESGVVTAVLGNGPATSSDSPIN